MSQIKPHIHLLPAPGSYPNLNLKNNSLKNNQSQFHLQKFNSVSSLCVAPAWEKFLADPRHWIPLL